MKETFLCAFAPLRETMFAPPAAEYAFTPSREVYEAVVQLLVIV